MKKKGISPLIATVILIGFVFVLGALAFLFLTDQIEAFGSKTTKACSATEAAMAQISVSSCVDQLGTKDITITNTGQGEIDGVVVRMISSSGEAIPTAIQWGLGAGSTQILEAKDLKGYGPGGKVEVAPFLFIPGSSEITICEQSQVSINC